MTKFSSIENATFQNKVKKWIDSDGEIYVNVGFWRAGGDDVHILCESYASFLEILLPLKEKKGAMTVLRNPAIKIRGIADENLLKQAISVFPDGEDWFLICPDYDSPYNSLGSGDRTHSDMEELFQRFEGRFVVMGDDKDFPPDDDRDDVLVAKFNL